MCLNDIYGNFSFIVPWGSLGLHTIGDRDNKNGLNRHFISFHENIIQIKQNSV